MFYILIILLLIVSVIAIGNHRLISVILFVYHLPFRFDKVSIFLNYEGSVSLIEKIMLLEFAVNYNALYVEIKKCTI